MKKSFKLFMLVFALLFTFTVKVNAANVAQIDTTYYETLQKAIDAAKDGETIKLVTDIELELGDGGIGFTINADDDFTLDLNGYKITSPGIAITKSSYIIVNKGKLIIKDSSDDESGKIEMKTSGSWNASVQATPIINHGTLTVESGTIATYRTSGSTMTYAIDTYSSSSTGDVKTIINGGFIYSDYCALRASAGGKQTKIEINSGKVESINRPIFTQVYTNNPATINITGGTITSIEKDIFYISDETSTKLDVIGVTNIKISGGVISSALGNLITYDTVEENEKVIASLEITGGTFNELNEALPLEEGTKLYEILIGEGDKKYVVAKESELVEEVFTGKIKEEVVDAIEKELVEETIANKYTVVGYYDINLGKFTPNDDLVGLIEETEEEITVTLEIPKGLEVVAEGYIRNFAIIRIHDGESDTLDAIDNGDGTVSFKTNKFSTYVLVYEDVLSETSSSNPKTYDGIDLYFILGAMSLFGLAAVRLYTKKKKIFS